MQKYIAMLSAVSVLLLTMPSTTRAAEIVKDHAVANSAEANFLTSSGCEDVSVGVSVTQKNNKTTHTKTAILSVFGSIVDICEFGSSTSFFGTTTVTDAEFTQNGVDGATLVKSFVIDGNQIDLNLVWTGTGVIGGEDLTIKDKADGVHLVKKWDIDSRNAEMSGVFSINGLNRISESSLVNAQLEVVKSNVKTITKEI